MSGNIKGPDVVILAEQGSDLLRHLQARLPVVTFHTVSASSTVATDSLATARVLIGPPTDIVSVLPQCPRVEWVQSTWAGVDDILAHGRADFLLTNLRGVFGPTMSAFVIAWILAYARNVFERSAHRSWSPYAERSLVGRRLGIMGTGSIGQAVAKAAWPLGFRLYGLNTSGVQSGPFERCFATKDRLRFAQDLDFLVSVLPRTPRTHRLIDKDLLNVLAPGAVLINAGRGNVLDQEAMLAALDSRQLRAAVLDVFDDEPLPNGHPLWARDDVVVTSHTAAPTDGADVASVFEENYRLFCSGQALQHRVDFERGY